MQVQEHYMAPRDGLCPFAACLWLLSLIEWPHPCCREHIYGRRSDVHYTVTARKLMLELWLCLLCSWFFCSKWVLFVPWLSALFAVVARSWLTFLFSCLGCCIIRDMLLGSTCARHFYGGQTSCRSTFVGLRWIVFFFFYKYRNTVITLILRKSSEISGSSSW